MTAKTYSRSRPTKKTGKVATMKSIGGRMPSSLPPRRHALTTPTSVPIAKAMIVVTPTSASVQGSLPAISSSTGTRCAVRPNWPVKQFAMYCRYVTTRFSWTLTPNSICSACNAAGLTPWNVASTEVASLPGITRGMMKLTVRAAQSVMRNRPTRRVTYLTAASAAP